MVEVFLVLEIFLAENAQVEDQLCGALHALKPACSSAMILSTYGFNLFSMTLLV